MADASRNPKLFRQRWMNLDRGCFKEPDVIEWAAMDESGSRMLQGTRLCIKLAAINESGSWMFLGS